MLIHIFSCSSYICWVDALATNEISVHWHYHRNEKQKYQQQQQNKNKKWWHLLNIFEYNFFSHCYCWLDSKKHALNIDNNMNNCGNEIEKNWNYKSQEQICIAMSLLASQHYILLFQTLHWYGRKIWALLPKNYKNIKCQNEYIFQYGTLLKFDAII